MPTQYLPPGPYISEGRIADTIITANVPRVLCLVGPGLKTLEKYDVAIRRGYRYQEPVSFSASLGYQHAADLNYTSNEVKETSVLEYFDGTNYVTVDKKYWGYIDGTHIYIMSEAYKASGTYYFSYQSTNATLDTVGDTPPDIRSIIRIGDRPGITSYTSGVDYTPNISFGTITASGSNSGSGVVSYGTGNTYKALEPRTYTITIATGGSVGTATFNWHGNTVSSGSGTATTSSSGVSLEDGIVLAFSGTFTSGDIYTFHVTNTGEIKWGVSQTVVESKSTSDIRKDYTGIITGTPGTYYTILSHIPTGTVTATGSGGGSLSVSNISGTVYVTFSSDPSAQTPITLQYPWSGNSPAYGAIYYVSYAYDKPSAMYNTPRLVFSASSLWDEVGGKTQQNLLALAGDIAFAQGVPYLYYVQISDPDGDGVYSDVDYINGIKASEEKTEITDVVVLESTDTIRSALRTSIEKCSSPIEKKYRMGWFWMPMGTPSGDMSTPDTLVYEAKVSMQLPPTSPALGRYVLVGNTWAQRQFLLRDSTTWTGTLPAWSIATALAALQDTFQSPSDTLLRREIVGFSDVETLLQSELDYRAGNDLLCLQKLGSLIRVYDTCTVHSLSEDVHEPSATVQKDAVTKTMNARLDAKIIGGVYKSTADAISAIRAEVALVLTSLVAEGTIAPYETETGITRSLNPIKDIYVARVTGSRTGYNFKYFFFLRYPVKHLFGEYFVDQQVLFGSEGTPTIANV